MKTKPHERLLFHWIGRDIEAEIPGRDAKARAARAERYVAHLSGSLDKGLWVKAPDAPEPTLGAAALPLPRLPMACFTEWRPEESRDHVAAYGKLGLGFARNWVSKRGGQPVTYVPQNKNSRFVAAMAAVAAAMSKPDVDAAARQHLAYLLHFAKPIRDVRSRPAAANKPVAAARRSTRSKPDPFRRSFGEAMPYVAEREWRIVGPSPEVRRGPGLPKHFVPALPGARPAFYLPYEAGRELFTLVMPDNFTMNRVLSNDRLRAQLFPRSGPHVTLLTLEDVGSF